MRIGKPTAYRDGMLWVENVGCWGVVDDDRVFQVSTDLGEVLHIVAAVVVATFSEKSVVDDAMNVQLIQQRVAVLCLLRQHSKQSRTRWGKHTLETDAVNTTTS